MIVRRVPTASRAYVAERCPPSHVLPWADEDSYYAFRGRQFHDWLEGAVTGAPSEPHKSAKALADNVDLEWLSIDVLDMTTPKTETPYVWDPNTSVVHDAPNRHDRPEGVYVRVDAETVKRDGTVAVYDWKTGGTFPTQPRKSLQSKIEAIAVAGKHGAESVEAHVVWFRPEERAIDLKHTFSLIELAAARSRVRRIVQTVSETAERMERGEDVRFKRGTWCTYCPAISTCPAHKGIVEALAPVADVAGALSDERLIDAYRSAKTAEAVAKRVVAAVEQQVEARGGRVEHPDGSSLEIGSTVREYLVHERVAKWLLNTHGPDALVKASWLGKKGLQRALGTKGKNEALRAIRAHGWVDLKEYPKLQDKEAE